MQHTLRSRRKVELDERSGRGLAWLALLAAACGGEGASGPAGEAAAATDGSAARYGSAGDDGSSAADGSAGNDGVAAADGSAAVEAATAEVELLTGTHDISLQTSLGTITLELDADAAPLAATNFVLHTRSGYYDGVTFHRVVPGFMIQGGDPLGTGRGGESVFGEKFADEFDNGLAMDRGVIAMANRGPDTNGSQFFIVQARAGTPSLLGKHTIFGHVTDGLDVVDAIAAVARDGDDRPLSPITMTPVEL